MVDGSDLTGIGFTEWLQFYKWVCTDHIIASLLYGNWIKALENITCVFLSSYRSSYKEYLFSVDSGQPCGWKHLCDLVVLFDSD